MTNGEPRWCSILPLKQVGLLPDRSRCCRPVTLVGAVAGQDDTGRVAGESVIAIWRWIIPPERVKGTNTAALYRGRGRSVWTRTYRPGETLQRTKEAGRFGTRRSVVGGTGGAAQGPQLQRNGPRAAHRPAAV